MDYLYILPELIIVAVALVLLVGAALSPKDRQGYMPVVATAGFLAALVAVYPALGQETNIFGRMITVDGFAQFFKVIFLIVGVLVTLSSAGYMSKQKTSGGEYYVLLMFAVTGMIFMASSTDLLAIWLGLELVSISSYILAGYRREDPKSNEAAIKYFLMGAIASAVLLFGLSLVYGYTGTTNLVDIAQIETKALAGPAVLGVAMFMLVAGFGFKVAMVPFHMWAPDAYEGAPTPVTAFFSIGPKAAGLAAMIRIFPVGLSALTSKWSLLFAIIAAVTMTVGNLTALSQKNIKRMMAYSSIAQVGYITIGLAVATAASVNAIMFYIMAYVFINAGLFSMIILLDERGIGQKIEDYAGLSQRAPVAAAAMVVFFIALIGIPFTSGFFAKFFIFAAAVQSGFMWLAIILAVNSAISVGYYYGVVKAMYLDAPKDASPVKVPRALGAVLLTGALATLALGVFSEPFIRLIGLASLLR